MTINNNELNFKNFETFGRQTFFKNAKKETIINYDVQEKIKTFRITKFLILNTTELVFCNFFIISIIFLARRVLETGSIHCAGIEKKNLATYESNVDFEIRYIPESDLV